MVTDRKIIIANGNTSVDLTFRPFTVRNIEGFDQLEIQNVTSQGFDQDGASLLNSYVLPRDMKITGQLKAESTYQMQKLREKLQSVILPKRDLEITHFYGGVNRVIIARAKKTPEFEFTNVSSVQNYTIELKATEPYWRDENETLVQIANVVGKFHFPLYIPKNKGVCFGIKSSSLIADVFNQSSIKVGMKIVFIANGSLSNPQLFNVNTREFFRLKCDMKPGEKITVVTGTENTVTREKNGIEEDYIGKVDLQGGGDTFLELDPGDNLFRYGADSGEDMLEIKILFQNRYPGV